MIDRKAFRSLSYGLYVISSEKDGKPVGCVVNTFAQVTSTPAQVSVAVNKENYTAQAIAESKKFEVAVLDESASMELIGTFGFHSSAEFDKFAEYETDVSSLGLVYLCQSSAAHFSVAVTQQLDLGSHLLFVGEVRSAEVCSDVPSMTYSYYHQVKGGKTPPRASSYNEGDDAQSDAASAKAAGEGATSKTAWRCKVCGHIEYADELPDDFVCPICGVGKDQFERL